jgi:hypothetical protein
MQVLGMDNIKFDNAKKQNVEIESAVSSGGPGKYMKFVSFP